MADGKPAHSKSLFGRLGLKCPNKHNLLFFYLPAQGVASFAGLSINSMNPRIFYKLFPKKDITSTLLACSTLGTGLYLYNRPHLQSAPTQLRLSFSVYGALLFNFGSLLLFAVAKSYLPENTNLATLVGVASCYSLVKVGTSYLDHIDSQLERKQS
ncbi:uncharacterized protein LOC132192442 [Neocloeon triangulifer]|uniref:uncharacterized protein LOC132192442 n=1 Tax=Neocloeon triangulifer TaxID=2078957 RepID=UPI00286F1E20|nr:uncharacterized protein LOC132192442 [Neocloeon triangulifer]